MVFSKFVKIFPFLTVITLSHWRSQTDSESIFEKMMKSTVIVESTEVPPKGHRSRIMDENGHFGVENYEFNISLKIILFQIDGTCFLNNVEMTF